jgi:hypothetical protein
MLNIVGDLDVNLNVEQHIMLNIVDMQKNNWHYIEDIWVTSEDIGDTEETGDIGEGLLDIET